MSRISGVSLAYDAETSRYIYAAPADMPDVDAVDVTLDATGVHRLTMALEASRRALVVLLGSDLPFAVLVYTSGSGGDTWADFATLTGQPLTGRYVLLHEWETMAEMVALDIQGVVEQRITGSVGGLR